MPSFSLTQETKDFAIVTKWALISYRILVAGFVLEEYRRLHKTSRETFPQKLSSKEMVSDSGWAASLLWVEITGTISQLLGASHVSIAPRAVTEKSMSSMGVWARNPQMMVLHLQIAPNPDYVGRHSTVGQTSGLNPRSRMSLNECNTSSRSTFSLLTSGQWYSTNPSTTSCLGCPGSCYWFKSACGGCQVFSWVLGLWYQV